MKNGRTMLIVSLLLLLTSLATPSLAGTYYVSPAGTASWSAAININTPCSWQTAMTNAIAGDLIYFRGGTYNVGTIGTQRDYANMRPTNSGTALNPITFVAYFGETPVVTGTYNGTGTAALFGCSYVNYVIWDGFTATTILYTSGNTETQTFGIWGGTNCVIKNSDFTGINVGSRSSNTSAIRIEGGNNHVAENNQIHDMTGTSSAVNTTGVWLFNTDNAIIRNNTFVRTIGAVHSKTGTTNSKVYKNFIHDSTGVCQQGIFMNMQGPGTSGPEVYQNIIVGCIDPIMLPAVSNTIGGKIYNNVLYKVGNSHAGITVEGNSFNIEIFNNIIYGHLPYERLKVDSMTIANYNIFYNNGYNQWFVDWSINYSSLSSWYSATLFDSNSYVEDPIFVNPGGSTPTDYKINAIHKNAGRGGNHATVIGAYITGNEIIGASFGVSYTPPLLRPSAPSSLRIQQ